MTLQWIVTWDFPIRQPRKRTFYQIFHDEFGSAKAECIQQSVLLCEDSFVANRVRALAEYFGATVRVFEVNRESLVDADGEGKEFVARIRAQRLKRRGRKPKSSK